MTFQNKKRLLATNCLVYQEEKATQQQIEVISYDKGMASQRASLIAQRMKPKAEVSHGLVIHSHRPKLGYIQRTFPVCRSRRL